MQTSSLIFLCPVLLFSGCLNGYQTKDSSCLVKWQLVEMTGNMANVAPLKGEQMNWQESYTLRPDSTFTKERKGERQLQASGRYSIVNSGDDQFIEFTYGSAHEIVGSCFASDKESLRLSNDKLYGTWQACDGPGLTYERVTVNCED